MRPFSDRFLKFEPLNPPHFRDDCIFVTFLLFLIYRTWISKNLASLVHSEQSHLQETVGVIPTPPPPISYRKGQKLLQYCLRSNIQIMVQKVVSKCIIYSSRFTTIGGECYLLPCLSEYPQLRIPSTQDPSTVFSTLHSSNSLSTSSNVGVVRAVGAYCLRV